MPKQNRLRSKKEFVELFSKGRKVYSKSFQVFFLRRDGAEGVKEEAKDACDVPRIGVVLSKKNEKSAAKRNLARRRVKEILRPLLPTITPSNLDVVFLLSSTTGSVPFSELKDEITEVINEIVSINRKREAGE